MKNLYKLYYQDYYTDVDFSFLLDDNSETPQNEKDKIQNRNQELCGTNMLKVIDNPAQPME